MITKADVVEFLSKVKHKARKAIREKWVKRREEVWKETAKELEGEFNEAQKHLNDLVASYRRIHQRLEEIGIELSYAGLYSHHEFLRHLTVNEDDPVSCYHMVMDMVITPELEAVDAEYKKTMEEVDQAYRVVEKRISRMRSVKQMIDYLKSLGFDTSYLEERETLEVDASKLFPCGEAN